MKKISVIAITKNGINISKKILRTFRSCKIYAPIKFSNGDKQIVWYSKSTQDQIKELFYTNDAVICLFSLGAVVRLIAPHIKSKKIDPAIISIDDKAKFVISVLSGHIGGANEITNQLANKLDSISVVTTASEVNNTIPIDILGKEFNWFVESKLSITTMSAFMINGEKIGVYQDAGEKNWWRGKLPKNITSYPTIKALKKSDNKAFMIISDKIINDKYIVDNSVMYRPRSLVIGIGLHQNTTKETIKKNLKKCLEKFELCEKSIAKFATINKQFNVKSLINLSKEMKTQIEYFEKDKLAKINVPNPSKIVNKFEKTYSVSEAAAILSSDGELIVEKQKFPPDLTLSIARIKN